MTWTELSSPTMNLAERTLLSRSRNTLYSFLGLAHISTATGNLQKRQLRLKTVRSQGQQQILSKAYTYSFLTCPCNTRLLAGSARTFVPGKILHEMLYPIPACSYSSSAPKNKRIPLSQTEEIDEVLIAYADIIQEFAEVLGCTESQAADLVRHDTRLVTLQPKQNVISKMKLLFKHGFLPEEIIGRPQVFSRSHYCIQSRLEILESVKHYRRGLVFLLITDAEFQARITRYRNEVAILGQHSCQASFVAELLESTEKEIISLAENRTHSFLLTCPPSRLQEIVRILKFFGITIAEIRQHCLMLKCPPEVAKERLQYMCDLGLFKPDLVYFLLTNSEAHIRACLPTWLYNAKALEGYANEKELLMDRLNCSEQQLEDMMYRNSRLTDMTPGKIKRTLDVLQNEIGISSEIILQHGNLLYFSKARLLSRWALLRSLDLPEADLVKDLTLNEHKFVAKYGFESQTRKWCRK